DIALVVFGIVLLSYALIVSKNKSATTTVVIANNKLLITRNIQATTLTMNKNPQRKIDVVGHRSLIIRTTDFSM
ncbi:hypothetical protein, partial [Lacticaseibacillus paracasei]|uniref:hypothetical protein n=1 Tax=Lacticaseibacillus paracasei TaxID=1597 RepID=UPI0005F130F1